MNFNLSAQHGLAGPSGRQLSQIDAGEASYRRVSRFKRCRSSPNPVSVAEKPQTGPKSTCTVHFTAEDVTVTAAPSEELMEVSLLKGYIAAVGAIGVKFNHHAEAAEAAHQPPQLPTDP